MCFKESGIELDGPGDVQLQCNIILTIKSLTD